MTTVFLFSFRQFRCLRGFRLAALLGLSAPCLLSSFAADLTTWPSQYAIRPWETARLTEADVVGPDGIVYPNLTGVGVTGGIPDINNTTLRAGYTVYDVTTYGAAGDGVTDDDAPVASALAAARANSASGVNKSVLYFPTGTYLLTDPLTINENNVVVDGDGPASTIIKLQAGNASTAGLFTIKKPVVYIGYIYPTTNILRGATSATFDKDPAANGYSVGTWARLLPTKAGTGTTMTDRYSNPANNVIYTDALWHFGGRMFFAKVTSINSATKTMTFDRSFTHDFYTNEVPELRTNPMVENSGVQDLTIETTTSAVTMYPLQFDRAANCWIKNVTVNKAKNWALSLNNITRFEVRDSVFNASWTNINAGSVAYLGWISSSDVLMDNCQANDQRHMAIYQMANRSVVRNSTFTGTSIQSPQLHGRMPTDNLIEGSTFETRAHGSTAAAPSGRGITAYASDGAATLRHGIEGPRNVFYNNKVNTGMGSVHLQGINENLIFVYNRILKTNDIEAYPSIVAMDRTFDTIVRGNIFQAMIYTPFISLEDPTCTGWSVTDNQIYGSNRYLYEGDSDLATVANNRFFPIGTTPPAATSPEATSIYAWQKTNASTARLVIVLDNRTVTDLGGTTTASIVRVKSATTSALTVNLSTDIAGLAFPATVTIPAGEVRVTVTLTGAAVTGGEKTVTLTASASGLLSDTEKVQVLDQDVTQPDFGLGKMTATTAGLPSGWKARNNGQVTAVGSQSYNSTTDTWSITGAGLTTQSYDGSLYRSGRRFVYASVDGDGEIRARLASTTGESQVGLMIADDEATGTDHIWIEPNGRVISSGDAWDTHGKPTYQVAAGTKTVPIWLRLKRVGTTFSAFTSTVNTPTTPINEAEWTLRWSRNFYNHSTAGTNNADYLSRAVLDSRMHFGMFINSNSLTTTATATFTGLTITGSIVGTTQPPAAPSAFTAIRSGTTANLAWTDNSADETGFLLEYQINSGAWNPLLTTPANATGYAHTGLLDGNTYSYRVKSVRSTDSAASAPTTTASVSVPLSTLPLAPSGLVASSTTDVPTDELQLTWTDNAYNESGYPLERSTTSGGGFSLVTTLGAGSTAYTDSGLTEGTRYYYRVRATNSIGNSAYSSEALGTTLLNTPTAAAITSSSSTEVGLSWTDTSSVETGFTVERSTTSGGTFTSVGTAAANATTFTDTTVVAGTTYFFRIRTTNPVSVSDPSAAVTTTATSVGTAPFYEPFNYALSPSTIVGQAGSGNGGNGLWLGIAGTAPREALLTGNLSAGRITGLGNQLEMSKTSNSSRIALVLDATTKAVITPGASSAKTFWLSYLVRTSTTLVTNSNSQLPGLVLSSSANTQLLTLLAQNARRSQYAIAGSGLTTVTSATGAIAANTTYFYLAKITVTDTDGSAANGFEQIGATLWQYPAGTLPPTTAPTSGGITRSTATVSSRLFDRVEIQGGNTANPFTFDEIRIAPAYAQVALPTAPVAPSSLIVSGATNTALTLTWTDNAANETAYKVQRALATGGPYSDLVSNLAANTTNYTDTGLSTGTTYHYRVRALNINGSSDPATGSGSTTPTGVQTFRTTNSLATDGSQDLLTPAGDGVQNLLKYAFNMLGNGSGQAAALATPNASILTANGSAGLPLVDADGTGKLRVTYVRRKSTSNSGISYVVEFSDTLANGTWTVNASATTAVTSIDATFERVVVTDSNTPTKRFVRVRVTLLP